MVYSEKFVAVLVVDGKILREIRTNGNDEVRIPFGTEYSIRFKNLNSTRVAVSVSIDGDDALDGNTLVIGPNEEHELKGFMQGGSVRNRFKFIEKTNKISEYRGDHIDDGIIRIEYQFEKKPQLNKYYDPPKVWPSLYPPPYDPWTNPGPYKVTHSERTDSSWANPNSQIGLQELKDNKQISFNSSRREENTHNILRGIDEEGITVKGSQTHQAYSTTWLGAMEEVKHVITFQLKGAVESNKARKKAAKVVEPLYTKTKITCPTCGIKSKSSCRFCSECGTSLI